MLAARSGIGPHSSSSAGVMMRGVSLRSSTRSSVSGLAMPALATTSTTATASAATTTTTILRGACALSSFSSPDLMSSLASSAQWKGDFGARRGLASEAGSGAKARGPLSDTALTGTSAAYLEALFEKWQREGDAAVGGSWATFFAAIQEEARPHLGLSSSDSLKTVEDNLRLMMLVWAYQVRGHEVAKTNPIVGFQSLAETKPRPRELTLSSYGFTEADLDRPIFINNPFFTTGYLGNKKGLKLREYVDLFEKTYCGSMGVEYMHVTVREERNWIRTRIEADAVLSKTERATVLKRLIESDEFEGFLMKKFTTAKRFGLDGCESLVPALKTLVDHAAELGVKEVIMGMPHRGRLNVLANVVRKPVEAILKEFEAGGSVAPVDGYSGSGDVKYHLGTHTIRPTASGKKISISLLANPSHLEAVNPVVLGTTRSAQHDSKSRKQSMSLLIHGDAAFCGQGVVYECFHLSKLPAYTVGGTVHVVVNNQVGFTTDPIDGRVGIHPTDVALTVGCPVFHVNGDDVDAVVRVMKLAAEYRQEFGKDVVVDIVGYRRLGHNEVDQPEFTQPLMYQKIKAMPHTTEIYANKLKAEGVVTEAEVHTMIKTAQGHLEASWKKAPNFVVSSNDWIDSAANKWAKMKFADKITKSLKTNVTADTVQKISKSLYTVPAGFQLHDTIRGIFKKREAMFASGSGFDWATAEGLAFGSLLIEGKHVRLSGQDCERGTFSHRHAVVHDQVTGAEYNLLNSLPHRGEHFTVVNSPLDEYAVLGFELGYSMEDPDNLVLWEAQFGDFANGAQIIFDQFLSSGEAKWLRQSGLTVLLPHGFDGMGPEHSSCRLERFLQMSDQDADYITGGEELIQKHNWQVCNITTPANYFHCLRRQLHRDFRKPLIIAAPKALLRHPKAVSSTKDFTEVEKFAPIIPEQSARPNPAAVKRLILCSGQVYYDLEAKRSTLPESKQGASAIIRIEQLAPFPTHLVLEEIRKYPNAEVMWVQEEPRNMGGYQHAFGHIVTAATAASRANVIPRYVGRAAAAAPGTGFGSLHAAQKAAFLNEALD